MIFDFSEVIMKKYLFGLLIISLILAGPLFSEGTASDSNNSSRLPIYVLNSNATFETTNNQAVKEGSLYYIIRILTELGNRPEAERVAQMLQQQFPKSSYIKLVNIMLAQQQ